MTQSNPQNPSVVVPAPPRPANSPLAGVKHIIAVGSGKGGVGKSTVAVNLSVALAKLGAKVGLLDADIYGPSVPTLLGTTEPPMEDEHKRIHVPTAHGIKCMSMGLVGANGPVVWRGPIASRAISQFLGEVDWGELDYLIIDMPPGTGDIQLTIAQSARLSGAIIVMTPQGLAVDIAQRGLKMFQQVRVPILGLVENMSGHECEQCHHVTNIFKKGAGTQLAKALHLPLLAELPLDPIMVDEADHGKPVVISRPESATAKKYFALAQNMAAELSTLMSGGRQSKPVIVSMDPSAQAKAFKITWTDNKQSLISFKELRFLCPCANCVDENSGQRKIKKESISDEIQPLKVTTVGNYAVSVAWNDSHDTGIYSYDYLRSILVK